jgi:DNA-binding response OmpR family regulator
MTVDDFVSVEGLEPQSFDVILATDGALGLRMAEAVHPDAILLDVLLPMLTGVEVLQRLNITRRSQTFQ